MFYHFMPLPIVGDVSFASILTAAIWLLPMALIYFWHTRHEHEHTKEMEKKLDTIAELLKKMVKNG